MSIVTAVAAACTILLQSTCAMQQNMNQLLHAGHLTIIHNTQQLSRVLPHLHQLC